MVPFAPGWDLVGVVDRLGDCTCGIEPGQILPRCQSAVPQSSFPCRNENWFWTQEKRNNSKPTLRASSTAGTILHNSPTLLRDSGSACTLAFIRRRVSALWRRDGDATSVDNIRRGLPDRARQSWKSRAVQACCRCSKAGLSDADTVWDDHQVKYGAENSGVSLQPR